MSTVKNICNCHRFVFASQFMIYFHVFFHSCFFPHNQGERLLPLLDFFSLPVFLLFKFHLDSNLIWKKSGVIQFSDTVGDDHEEFLMSLKKWGRRNVFPATPMNERRRSKHRKIHRNHRISAAAEYKPLTSAAMLRLSSVESITVMTGCVGHARSLVNSQYRQLGVTDYACQSPTVFT